jgi:hypothetical protein
MEIFTGIKPSVWLTLFGGIFILIGLVFVWVAVKTVREDLDSRSWPTTVARLQDVEVVKRVREKSAEKHYVQRVTYLYALSYEYRIGDRDYTARISEAADTREDAVRMAASHKVGETRSIRYNRKQPDRYRFELTSPYAGLFWLLPFAGFAGFGWAIIYVGRRFYGA